MITTATQAFSSRDWALLAAATQDGQQFSACANVMAFYAIHPSAPSATVLGERRAAGDAFIAELDEGDRRRGRSSRRRPSKRSGSAIARTTHRPGPAMASGPACGASTA